MTTTSTPSVAEVLERFSETGELPEEFVDAIARGLGRRCFTCHRVGRVTNREPKTIAGERTAMVVYYSCPFDGHDWEQYELLPPEDGTST